MAAPYLTPTQLRAAVPSLADPTKYPDTVLADLVAEFEEIVEDYRGVAYTPRTVAETHTLPISTLKITLRHIRVRSVASVVLNGVTIDPTTYQFTDYGTLMSRIGFVVATLLPTVSAVVTYDHGYDTPPKTVLRACRLYVFVCAVADRSSVPRDIIATSSDGLTTRYSTPDKSSARATGYIEIDRLLNSLQDERMAFA